MWTAEPKIFANIPDDELTDEQVRKLCILDHDRWCEVLYPDLKRWREEERMRREKQSHPEPRPTIISYSAEDRAVDREKLLRESGKGTAKALKPILADFKTKIASLENTTSHLADAGVVGELQAKINRLEGLVEAQARVIASLQKTRQP